MFTFLLCNYNNTLGLLMRRSERHKSFPLSQLLLGWQKGEKLKIFVRLHLHTYTLSLWNCAKFLGFMSE